MVNTPYFKHVKFKMDEDEDFSDNPSEIQDDEDDMDDQLQVIHAILSARGHLQNQLSQDHHFYNPQETVWPTPRPSKGKFQAAAYLFPWSTQECPMKISWKTQPNK